MATTETIKERHNGLLTSELDTICAPATAMGGAICVIRVSGRNCLAACDAIFHAASKKPLAEIAPQHVTFGTIEDEVGKVVDEVLLTLFRAPHSYTGEDVVEISTHASTWIVHEVLRLLCAGGCRMAEPGEFTRRAFLNGKMDLSQAEAVADVISASSAEAHRVAINQLRGHYSSVLHKMREDLQRLAALLELELDFSDHETMEFADREELSNLAQRTSQRVNSLAKSYFTGKALKNGVPVAIVGKTNVGKSTLLNCLLKDDRAIVSDIHGTTRDTIEDTITLHGVPFHFIDTAGLRHTHDEIEQIGIARTYDAIARANIVVYVFDGEPSVSEFEALKEHLDGKKLICVQNKVDTLSNTADTASQEAERNRQNSTTNHTTNHPLKISAKHHLRISELEEAIYQAAGLQSLDGGDTIVTSARHYDALLKASEALRQVIGGLQSDIPTDLLAEDLRTAIKHISEITGHTITPETTLHHIFAHFCIGK